MTRKSTRQSEAEADALNAFRRIIRALRVSAQRAQSHTGMSGAQLYVLAQLADGSALSINELGELTFTDRSSVGAVVARLVERGLAERARAADDRRRAQVRITDAGLAALKRAPDPPTRSLVKGLKALDEGTLEQMADNLNALVRAMGLAEAPAEMLFDDESGRPRRSRRQTTSS